MDQPEARSEPRNILDRLSHFLEMFTSGLLSTVEQADMLEIFRSLAHECQGAGNEGSWWESPISIDGFPFEFSLAIDRNGSISVRYVVDTQRRPARPEDLKSTMRRNANMVVPCHQHCSELVDTLCDQYFAHTPQLNVPLVLHGIRVARGKGRAGRLYFRTWDRPQEEVRNILSQCLHPNDLKDLRSSCASHFAVAGVAYDFDARDLARIKIYLWTQGSAREAGLAAAREFLGEDCCSLEELLDIISDRRHPLRVIPRIFLGLGFRPQGGYRDVKLSLPLCEWGRSSFHRIMPAVSQALSTWGIDIDCTRQTSVFQPPWRFQPSWLSADRSPKGDSLSVYFVPIRNRTALCSVEDLRRTPREESVIDPIRPGTSAVQSAILQQMFDLLLNADACDLVAR